MMDEKNMSAECPDEVPPTTPETITKEEINHTFSGWVIQLIQCLMKGERIPFIKVVRELAHEDLRTAKELSESIFARLTFPTLADSWAARNTEMLQRDAEANRREIVDQDKQIVQLTTEKERLADILNELYAERDNAREAEEERQKELDRAYDHVRALERLLAFYIAE